MNTHTCTRTLSFSPASSHTQTQAHTCQHTPSPDTHAQKHRHIQGHETGSVSPWGRRRGQSQAFRNWVLVLVAKAALCVGTDPALCPCLDPGRTQPHTSFTRVDFPSAWLLLLLAALIPCSALGLVSGGALSIGICVDYKLVAQT